MSEPKCSRFGRYCAVLRAAGLLVLLILIVFETLGFPSFVTDALTRRFSQANYVIKADGMRLDLLTGLYFRDVAVFRKGVVGPPAIECQGMRVRCNPFGCHECDVGCINLEFIGGTVSPGQAAGKDEEEGSRISSLHVTFTDMSVEKIMVERMTAEISAYDSIVSVSNIVCAIGGEYGKGTASGAVKLDAEGGMVGRIVTKLDPHLLLPILERIEWNYTCRLIRRFEWGKDKPLVDTQFAIGSHGGGVFESKSVFSMRDYSYRGVANDTCDGVLSVGYTATSGVVSVDHIMIGIDEGVIAGDFAYDSAKKSVSYRTVTDVDPKDFFQMIGLFERPQLENWSFPGVTRFISEGLVDFDKSDGDRTRVLAEVESAGMGLGPLAADSCRFNVNMNGSTCRLTNIQGTIWDGEFEARSEVVFGETNDVVTFGCEIDNCDFAKVASSFSTASNDMSGKFYIEMDGRFILSSNALETMSATGRMSVDDGKVFQLPIFGGLTRIMAKLIPGLDFVIAQSDMTAEFQVNNGRVSSEKISIDGDVLSLAAKGSASFEGDLDFAIQLKLMSEHSVVAKLLRAVTWPISKLMEFRLKGSPEDPKWYPINFSTELLERVGLKKGQDPGN